MANRHYDIKLFDQVLVQFSLSDGIFGTEASIDDWDEAACNLMPCGLEVSPEGIWRWLEIRSIPANRRNAARICAELGFNLGDLESLYRVSMGLSLNDSYWVTPRGFSGKFDDYNLFDNPFSEAIGALAVAGEASGFPLEGNTPELTTDGTLRKGWRIVDGARLLYKGSSDGFAPGEPLSEYISSLIASDLKLNAVRYTLDEWQGEMCSVCQDFATKNVSYVPFAVATGATDLASVLHWCASLSSECFEQACDMLAFDALVCNTDRHLTNFGILRDNATGRALGLAPVFDNGRALFPNVPECDTQQFLLESQLRSPAFGASSFSEMAGRVCGERQASLLGRAAERGIIGNVSAPRKRVASLDAFVRRNAESLLGQPIVDHEALKAALAQAVGKRPRNTDNAFRLNPRPSAA